MYIVEGYPEFEQDVKEIWNDFIIKNNFEVFKINKNSIELRNKKCILQLDLNAGQSINYYFQNPKTLKVTHSITLEIYFGKEPIGNSLGGKEYPLTMDEWIDFYAEDDYRSICKIDLPIILDEIKENWQFVIDGDFSWEKNIEEWEKWYDMNHKGGIPNEYKKLSYNNFLKDQKREN